MEIDCLKSPDVSAGQIRAARALLDWTLVEASARLGIGKNTLNRIETGRSNPADRTVRDIVRMFEDAGVSFFVSEGGRGLMLAETADTE